MTSRLSFGLAVIVAGVLGFLGGHLFGWWALLVTLPVGLGLGALASENESPEARR